MTAGPAWGGRHRVLLHGGRILSPQGEYRSLLIDGGAISWIGDDPHGLHADSRLDLQGAFVLPGFVDAHVHATSAGLALIGLDLSSTTSLAEALDRIAAAASSSDGAVIGHGWDETRWPESRPPTRAEVDRAVGGSLAYLSRIDVHSALVSTALIDAVPGVDALDGFSVDGPLSRQAHHAVRDAAQQRIGPALRERAQRAMRAHAAALGIVAVQEMAGPTISGPDDLRALLALGAAEAGPVVHGYWGELASLGGIERARELGAIGVAGDLFIDGSIGSHTALLRKPYADAHGCGAAYLSGDDIAAHLRAATLAGVQAGFHVIGDAATDLVVDALTRTADELGVERVRSLRHRLEHAEMLDDRHISVLAHLQVTLSMQPVFDALWGGHGGMYERRLGPQRRDAMNRFATAHAAGVLLAFGSDAPVTPIGAWPAIDAAIAHHGAGERVSPGVAFAAHTVGGWRAIGCDDAGVIAVGAPAHLAVWSTLPEPGAAPTALRTIVHGRTVHDDGSLAPTPDAGEPA